MNESNDWSKHFDIFNTFSTKLSVESQQLKAKLEKEKKEKEKEKKELRRMSGIVNEQRTAQDQLK